MDSQRIGLLSCDAFDSQRALQQPFEANAAQEYGVDAAGGGGAEGTYREGHVTLRRPPP